MIYRIIIPLVLWTVGESGNYFQKTAEATTAPPICQHDNNNFRCVKYLRNYDADTITFNIPLIHPLLGKKISVRLRGIDTPEIRGKCSNEKKRALEAKQEVQGLLTRAKRIDLQNIERGKYFRIVADVIIDGNSLTQYLLKKKLGYPYMGGKKQKNYWCANP